jgi:hypothetical protein
MNTKTKTCLQCSQPSKQRGLCQKCYSRFRNAMQRLEHGKKKSFEQALVDAGQILPPAKREPDSYDPFGELADQLQNAEPAEIEKIVEKFRIENEKSQKLTVQQEADIVVENVKQAARRKGITPKKKAD